MTPRVPHPQPQDTPLDAALARAYRDAVDASASTAPSSMLDDAIRAAARRAVHAKPHDAAHAPGGGWFGRRWQTPLALAASMMLAVGIAIKVYDTGEADVGPEPRAAPTAEAPAQASTAVQIEAPAPTDAAAASASAVAASPAGASRRQEPEQRSAGELERSKGQTQERDATRGDSAESKRRELAKNDVRARDSAAPTGESKPFPAGQSQESLQQREQSSVGGASKAIPGPDAAPAETVTQPAAPAPSPASPQAAVAPPAAVASSPAAVATPPTAAVAPPPAPPRPAPAASARSPAAVPSEDARTPSDASAAGTDAVVQLNRALRERAAMKVEQAQGSGAGGAAANGVGVGAARPGTGLTGRLEGRMQPGAGPAAAPRPLVASAQELESRPADDWIASIRELKRLGRTSEAGELLVAFGKKFPDFTLPDDLR